MRFTVFTPTYNRAHTLERLYNSLVRQSLSDFEWVIVDDASTDGTPGLLERMRRLPSRFPITLVRVEENGGKHRAINRGVRVARGELFFIVDSDDALPVDALQIIDRVEKSIPEANRRGFAGVCGLRAHFDGSPIGTTFSGTSLDIPTSKRAKHGITGDKAEVFDTNIMRAYPFPEFDNETFLTEAVVWDRIARDGLKLRFFNRVVCLSDYLEDGLSKHIQELTQNNPLGDALYIRQRATWHRDPFRRTLDNYVKYLDAHRNRMAPSEIAHNLDLPLWGLRGIMLAQQLRHTLRRTRAQRQHKESTGT